MKFGREFETSLKQEQYPQHWLQSAISYRQLKKCIRKIQSELLELGLEAVEVKQLLQLVQSADAAGTHIFDCCPTLWPNLIIHPD